MRFCEFAGQLRAAGEFAECENHGSFRIQDVLLGPFGVAGGSHLF